MTDDDPRSIAEVAGDLELRLGQWSHRLHGPVVEECLRVLDGWRRDDPEVTPELVRRTEAALRHEVDDR